jgi:hypothetical protein
LLVEGKRQEKRGVKKLEKEMERKTTSQGKAIEFLYFAIFMGVSNSYDDELSRLFYFLCNPYSIPLVLAAIFGVVSLLALPLHWMTNFVERTNIPTILIYMFDFIIYYILSRYL